MERQQESSTSRYLKSFVALVDSIFDAHTFAHASHIDQSLSSFPVGFLLSTLWAALYFLLRVEGMDAASLELEPHLKPKLTLLKQAYVITSVPPTAPRSCQMR